MSVTLKHGAKMFKTIIDVLKDVLMDVNMQFTSKGLKILSIDPEKMCILTLVLDSFLSYTHTEDVIVGIHLPFLYKSLRSVDGTDVLTLHVDEKGMRLIIESMEANVNRVLYIPNIMMPIDTSELDIPNYENSVLVNMKEFKQVLKDVSHLNKKVDMSLEHDNFIIRANNNMAQSEIYLKQVQWIKRNQTFVSRWFYPRNIEKLCKLYFIEKNIKVSFDTDEANPLLFEISLPCGKLSLMVATISD